MLVSKAGCEYVFQWDTNVVCFEETPTPPQDFCGYKDPQTLAVYNFTVLHKDSPYMVGYIENLHTNIVDYICTELDLDCSNKFKPLSA